MITNTGFEEGDSCNRNGCDGIIVVDDVEGCTCHLFPPCSSCTDPSRIHCNTCNWNGSMD